MLGARMNGARLAIGRRVVAVPPAMQWRGGRLRLMADQRGKLRDMLRSLKRRGWRMGRHRLQAAICAAALGFGGSAAAASDKSAYTLFDPTPVDQMRDFSTDRPNRSSSPYTVDAGHWQIESDLFNYSRSSSSDNAVQQITTVLPTVKLGLTNDADFEVVVPTRAWLKIKSSGVTSTLRGWTDLQARMKFNLFGNDSGDYALAVVPYVKFPSGSTGISNKKYEYGGYLPLYVKLNDKWSVIFLVQGDSLVSSSNPDLRRFNAQVLANVGYAASDTVTLSAEYYTQHKFGDHAPTVQTLDFAVAWNLGDDLQVDAAWYAPLNKASPDVTLYFGISKRW
jgi:Putative MetA-pathway of phenol degradation